MSKVLVLDCEIEKAILGKNETKIPGIQYAKWGDYLGMGISCIGAWESWTDRYRVFAKPPLPELNASFLPDCPILDSIRHADHVVTFNGMSFDLRLLVAHGINLSMARSYIDLLVEIRDKQGFDKYTKGFKLDDVARANGLTPKTGSGAHAPVLWQQGKYCEVIDYCLNDVWLTRELLQRCLQGNFINPVSMRGYEIILPFKSITRPVQYQTELAAAVDTISS